MKHKKIIAHRGASKDYRENTIDAIYAALQLGIDGVEIDIQQTKDNKLIVYHDDYIPSISKPKIKELTFDEIKSILRRQNIKVSLLDDVISRFKDKLFLDIEIKESVNPELLINTLFKYYNSESDLKGDEPLKFQIKSFYFKKLKYISKYSPFKIVYIINYKKNWLKLFKDYLNIKELKFEGIHLDYRYMKSFFIKLIKHPIWVWTVDNVDNLKIALYDEKIEGIITNEPSRARYLQLELININKS